MYFIQIISGMNRAGCIACVAHLPSYTIVIFADPIAVIVVVVFFSTQLLLLLNFCFSPKNLH